MGFKKLLLFVRSFGLQSCFFEGLLAFVLLFCAQACGFKGYICKANIFYIVFVALGHTLSAPCVAFGESRCVFRAQALGF